MTAYVFLSLALVGVISSTVFLGLALAGVARFGRTRRSLHGHSTYAPSASIFKPLHGMEPQLERNLASFFEQEYSGEHEILFCARSESDPAWQLAREIAARFPAVPARFITSGEPRYVNAKVWSLEQMLVVAKHELLVVTDSDVEVGRDYLRRVLAPFAQPRVGCVTCLYRGKPTGGLWSRLEGLGMSVEMTSGVLIANLLEGMKFALGPTMVCRREAMAQIGGFGVFADYCSDDFLLGNLIAARGWEVVLSDYVIDHVIQNRSFAHSIAHQVRWMRSTRFSRPKGHFGTGLTFAVPFGLLACFVATFSGHKRVGIFLLAWTIVTRIFQSVVVGGGVVRDRRAVTWAWLYPLRDLMGLGFWAASYLSAKIVWRDQVYRLVKDGRMVSPETAATSARDSCEQAGASSDL